MRCLSITYLKELRKFTKNINRYIQYLDRSLNPGPPRQEAQLLRTTVGASSFIQRMEDGWATRFWTEK